MDKPDKIPGLCGEHTEEKQEMFEKYIEHHINVVKDIYNIHGQQKDYLYYDLFAGPGHIECEEYEGYGSPIRFNRIMQFQEDIKYKMIVSESNPKYYKKLKEILELENAPFTIKDDAEKCIPSSGQGYQYGILYLDPPMTIESFIITKDAIKSFSKYYPQIDIIFYVSAQSMKRARGSSNKFSEYLKEFLVKEKDWIIKRPLGNHGQQYTFLVGTGYKSWALWKKQGFFDIDSHKGKLIFERLNYSEKEQKIRNIERMKQKEMF